MLSERELQVLRVVVDLHIRDGAPVSSLAVKESSGMTVSTATIRNVMAGLERHGYIIKPHTSAGRVPTDKGYRLYVDRLEGQPVFGGEFARRFRDALRDRDMDASVIMASATRVLGTLSENFAVVYGSVIQESRVSRIQLIHLDGARLLVVVNLVPEFERTSVIRMEKEYTPDVISCAERWINRVVEDKTLVEAKDELERSVRDNVTDEGIITREVSIHREDIFSEPPAVDLYFEERGHFLEQTELSDPKLLQLLLRLIHNKRLLTSVLAERLGERTRITIGSEHKEQELRTFSLVTAGYRMGVAWGVLGIIGPTRMRYRYNRDLVGSAAHELGAIGEEFF
jgi:heat-inducible transcriptional repressor